MPSVLPDLPAPTSSSPPQSFWLQVKSRESKKLWSPLSDTMKDASQGLFQQIAVMCFCREFSWCFRTQVQLLQHPREPRLSGAKMSISPTLLPHRCLSVQSRTQGTGNPHLHPDPASIFFRRSLTKYNIKGALHKDTGARSLSIIHERLTREAGAGGLAKAGLPRSRGRSCHRAEQSQHRSHSAPAQQLHISHVK